MFVKGIVQAKSANVPMPGEVETEPVDEKFVLTVIAPKVAYVRVNPPV
jgi:hypothetical protein